MKRVVYTYGAFDILHAGHIELLEKAKQLGDVLVVGLLSDNAISERKGNSRPIQPFNDRMCVLSSLRSVDLVVSQETYDPYPTMCSLPKVDVITKGDDHNVCFTAAVNYGCHFTPLPYSQQYSTTSIIHKIKNDNIK